MLYTAILANFFQQVMEDVRTLSSDWKDAQGKNGTLRCRNICKIHINAMCVGHDYKLNIQTKHQ